MRSVARGYPTGLRRRLRRHVRAALNALGPADIQPSPRTDGLHRLAHQEAGRRVPVAHRWFAYVARFPRSFVAQADALDGTKTHDFNFLGSMYSADVREARAWVLEFARRHFTDDSVFVATDASADHAPLGSFDLTHEERGLRFRPKEVALSDRLYFDERYFSVLRQSRFTLCPAGDAPWSMRFFEAILCGSIPIVADRLHTGRNDRERGIGYRYYVLGSDYVYRPEWVRHNRERFLRRQTFERSGGATS